MIQVTSQLWSRWNKSKEIQRVCGKWCQKVLQTQTYYFRRQQIKVNENKENQSYSRKKGWFSLFLFTFILSLYFRSSVMLGHLVGEFATPSRFLVVIYYLPLLYPPTQLSSIIQASVCQDYIPPPPSVYPDNPPAAASYADRNRRRNYKFFQQPLTKLDNRTVVIYIYH